MARARWLALALVAALVIGVAGCGSGETGRDVRKIAFVAPFRDNEPDWTLQSREVVAEFPRHLHVRVDTVDASQTSDLRGVFEQVGHEGDQLVIAHDSRYAEAAEAAAKQSRVPTLVWGERPNAPRGLVGQIHVDDKAGGYIAGLVAAKAAYTRRLGIIVIADGSAWDTATWNRMAGGFIAGARSIDPSERFYYTQVGEHGSATAQEVYDTAISLQKRGAQMIFALGGAATVGALRAVEKIQGEDQYIGVIGDKAEFNKENYVLESIMYDTRALFRRAVQDVRDGRFAQAPYALTLRNRGLWLLRTGRTPSDAYEAGLAAGRQIDRGRLQVPVTATREAVRALITGQAPEG
ncbi:MAG: BMP family ABC transporter substrate-binding protein [Actinobacteria bacterium]|nr:BMP family ABC transporter substrate-binding protein [Actinomycetota bacterium]